MTVNHAQRERRELAELFEQVGPDAPTLCEGWDASDLAAHIVVRERRPDTGPGILFAPLAGYSEKVRRGYASKPWPELVELVRSGPPLLSPFALPGVDRLANTMEFFIHHEDVRRAQGLAPRELNPDLSAQLWKIVQRMSRMLMRGAPVGIRLDTGDGRAVDAVAGTPLVTVTGEVGELALFAYGRQGAAQVDYDGPADAVDSVRRGDFGI